MFTSEAGFPIIRLDDLAQHLGDSVHSDKNHWLIGFQNQAAVERFEEWIRKQPLAGGQPMDVFVLNQAQLPFNSTDQELQISFSGAVTVPINRPIVLLVHAFGWLHKNHQRKLRHLVDGEGDADKSLAEGSLLIGTFIQEQRGAIDIGYNGNAWLIKDA